MVRPSRSSTTEGPFDPRHRPDPEADILAARELVADKFTGPTAELIIANLWTYAHRNLRIWISTNEIFSRCARFGRPPKRSAHWSFASEETILELADETVIAGLSLFKQAITAEKWDPADGASLQTYFLNACILAFPNTYRWIRTREERAAEPMDAESMHMTVQTVLLQHSSSEGLSLGALFCELDSVGDVLKKREPAIREIVSYIAEGYTAREAAERLGTTHRAVESHLRRIRAQLQMQSQEVASKSRHRA